MNLVFMGTPDFAVPALEALYKSKHKIVGVFSQPDKPVGRKQLLTPPPVKEFALQNGLSVYQPNSLKNDDSYELIKKLNPDIIIVAAYGKILPKDILDIPKYGCVNIHASLLPKYRGAAPIQWAVINGDSETGITIMKMSEGLDTGDMILVDRTEIGENETSAELFDRLADLGAVSLLKALDMLENDTAEFISQDDNISTYAAKITKALSPIDWSKSASEVHNLVRGLQTWPCASTIIDGKEFKIHKTVLSLKTGNKPGEIVDNKGMLTVCCGDGDCVDVLEIQPQGKKKMDIKSFFAGNKLELGTIIGE
ncbi:MAG: methionyl-tRNA formyltransferase [Eubacterium sp.]|nr:methionyl-tRNA formyltransferase [Eubacterium sp.]